MKEILVVAGPTAVGKTEYSIKLAQRLDGEIVSCDSMQLYKFMDIGSAKPTEEERALVKHYLVDEIDPREPFSVAEYQKRAKAAIAQIHEKGKLPVISGGTGLYLNSLLYEMDFSSPPRKDGYRKKLELLADMQGKEAVYRLLEEKDPDAAARIHPNNTKKIIRALEAVETTGRGIPAFTEVNTPTKDYRPRLIGLTRDRGELYNRINARVEILMERGLLAEVKGLLDMGLSEDNISMKGIGYKELICYLQGEYDLDTAVAKIQQNTRNYAKRQLTWFRRYDRINWFDLSLYESSEKALEDMILWLDKNK
ncbi:tRNA (adenosine(37)-N6)-dimethylallyltransferase MiaA [Anaerovorax odorimutans]|uniref:tRNA dimethylallyltransferase n=1 Tax=Anaerovorax odorimutans TaxID=109327 RepID=A0ABT1RL06_9FIRM|nr:tRNA (adenosine(37)-N6)-dimethylallyltransferase MiaA [Anaerovorax odorimutans]MCQ4635875.1 tRNA (adenosine(37)-N6)-dimethylallyltransferase MiaA [Anaerovorax odorimutans]